MIKLAYNKVKPNLVFEIDSIERYGLGTAGVIEKYVGTLTDTSTTPDTTIEGYKVQVAGFDAEWNEVPVDLGSTGDLNNQSKSATPSKSQQTIKPDTGYTGLDKVTIAATPLDATKTAELSTDADTTVTPSSGKLGIESVTVPRVTAAVDANIVAGNIKKDVNILGVTGTFEGGVQLQDVPSNYLDYTYNRLLFKTSEFTVTDATLAGYFEDLLDAASSGKSDIVIIDLGARKDIRIKLNAGSEGTISCIIEAYDAATNLNCSLLDFTMEGIGNTISYQSIITTIPGNINASSAYSAGILNLYSDTTPLAFKDDLETIDEEALRVILPIFQVISNEIQAANN